MTRNADRAICAHYYGIEEEAPYSFTPDADFPVINIEKGRLKGTLHAEFEDGLQLPGIISLQSGDKVNVVPQKARFVVAGLEENVIAEAAEQLEKEIGVTFSIRPADGGEQGEGLADVKQFLVEVKGQAAHASTPQEGKNALTAALRLISQLPLAATDGQKALDALDALLPYEDTCGKTLGIYREEEQSGALTLCFSILNYTPEKLTGMFDARLPIGCNAENTKLPVAEKLQEYGITLADTPVVEPHCVPGDSDFRQDSAFQL